MLATLLNLPKWLLALVAVCILAGHAEQVKCKTDGCKPATTIAKADASGSHDEPSAPDKGSQHCSCQCHFTTLTVYHVPASYRSTLVAFDAEFIAWPAHAPEAPCADIEHPPQLA